MLMTDLHWLAGYLDGEGCFTVTACKYHYPKITVEATDKDTITKVANLFGNSVYGPKSHGKHQQTWYTATVGKHACGWMQTLYPLLSTRRQNKIRSILVQYQQQ